MSGTSHESGGKSTWPHRPKAALVALDQCLAALIAGWPDATLSAWAYAWEREGVRAWPRRLIDTLFFWDADHCRESYENECMGRQLPEGWRGARQSHASGAGDG